MNPKLRALIMLSAAALSHAVAQDVVPSNDPLSVRIANVAVHNGTLLDGLAQFSSQLPELSVSFEQVLKAKISDPPLPEVRFDASMQNQTARDVLAALCSKDTRYNWNLDGATINVFPRTSEHNPSYLMNRRIPQLNLDSPKNAGEAAFRIAGQIPPPFEQIAYAQAGGDISYAVPWHASLQNVTVRHAFNLIARQLGGNGGWVLSGSEEFRTIGFHHGTIRAAQTEVSKE